MSHICPECEEPYDDLTVVDTVQSNAIIPGQLVADETLIYGCPNCGHACGIGCAHVENRIA